MNKIDECINDNKLIKDKVGFVGTSTESIDRAWKMLLSISGTGQDSIIVHPFQECARPSFLCEIGTEKYVVHLPRGGKEWQRRYKYKTELKLNNPFEVMESDDGILIERFALEKFRWTKNIIIELLGKIRDVHKRVESINETQDIFSYISWCETNGLQISDIPTDLYKTVHNILLTYRQAFDLALCHGDLWNGNVLLWRDKNKEEDEMHPYIIDWESICMCDPYYDLGKLYVSVLMNEDAEIVDPYRWLQFYLNRSVGIEEMEHFNFMLLSFYYVAILHKIKSGQEIIDETKTLCEMIRLFDVQPSIRFEGVPL